VTEPLPRSRGTVFVQVLVAAVFLAVIGGAVGLALGLRDRDGGDDPGSSGRGSATDGGGTTQPGGESPPSRPCPEDANQQAGRGDLAQVLYIQTEFSEVWICRDGGGALYYQGHRFTRDDRLFIPDVEQRGDEYVATNATDQTVYRVSRAKLVIVKPGGGKAEEQRVINSDG
jgi:hypothetical protein